VWSSYSLSTETNIDRKDQKTKGRSMRNKERKKKEKKKRRMKSNTKIA
jgi:hypothetical protein